MASFEASMHAILVNKAGDHKCNPIGSNIREEIACYFKEWNWRYFHKYFTCFKLSVRKGKTDVLFLAESHGSPNTD